MTEETIFAEALARGNPAERAAYLDKACAGAPALRKRVEALLASHKQGGDFLEHPAVEQMAASPPPQEATGAETQGIGQEDSLGFLQPSAKPGSLGRLAHYEVLEVIGRGGFGVVLKAFDEKLHRMVAIKVMAPQLAATSPPRKRFLREARAAAAIRHEHVVTIYAVEEQPIPYLVMEYIAGETLQQKLDRTGPLDVLEVLRLGQQIASGLAAAHTKGLIHRDIKPANILLENGVHVRVKITDFGLARTADDASLSQSGVIAGTPLYMAPEQARGEVIDQRADLFSLGSVLYVMCSGRPPFRAANTLGILKRVAEDTPRPIREIIPEVPRWLCAIVDRLHAKRPEDRFASAREVADLLARHRAKLQQDRELAPPPNVPRPAPKPVPVRSASPKDKGPSDPAPAVLPPRPRKWGWAVAAALLLVLAGLSLSEATGVTNVRGTVIRLFSPDGTLVVEVDDPDVSVTLDGGDVIITGAGVKEIRVRPGRYEVRATKDGKLVSRELVTVSKNGRQVVRVRKEAGPAVDADGGKKPGVAPKPEPPANQPLDLRYVPADASAAIVVRPQRIVRSPLAATALPPGAADEGLKGLGVKPEQIDQAIVFLQVGAAAAPAPAPAPPPPPTDGWTALDSKEGRFSIRFPAKPKPSDQKTTLGTRKVFTVEADEGRMTFELSYVDFPKNSPFIGDRSRVDFATRGFEFKPGFKSNKDIKLDGHLGAEVVVDDVQLRKYFVHRVYIVGGRLYHLEALTRKTRQTPAEFVRFFDSFKVTGAPAPAAPLPDVTPLPGAIIRFAEPVDGKRALTHLLKGLREESHEGKTYYRSSAGEAILGLPAAGAVPDARTVLIAPEPVLWKMLAAGGGAKSPLLDRLRRADTTDDVTAVVVLEPYRDLLKALAGQLKAQLPPDLAGAAGLPARLVAVTAGVNLHNKTLLEVALEADSAESVAVLDDLAFKGLNWARKVYPGVRPILLKRIPAEVVQPALAVADQLFGGIQVTKEGKRLVVRLEKPESLGTSPENDLIASAGFNDAKGMNSNPAPNSPYPLDSEGKQGGDGEPGWAGPWSTPSSTRVSFQKKVVHEGDGALYLSKAGADRRLAAAQRGSFGVEMFVQVPERGGFLCYLNNAGLPFRDGPVWSVKDGKFLVLDGPDKFRETGFTSQPRQWHKVALRVDVARKEWRFFVDDTMFETPKPLRFRNAEASLDTIRFQCETEAGIYIDALRITRQGVVTPPKNLIASSGFNDARGINSNPVPGSPFPLDSSNREGGLGEPGWAGPWDKSPDISFQSKVVFEGDGALYLKGRPNFGPYCRRVLTQPQTGRFQVEYRVQVPAGTNNYGLQIWPNYNSGPFSSGPISGVRNGKFGGNELLDSGFKSVPGQWHKVTMRIDIPMQNWELFVDDKPYPKRLKFRAKVESLSCLTFIVGEGGVYIDDVRVTTLP